MWATILAIPLISHYTPHAGHIILLIHIMPQSAQQHLSHALATPPKGTSALFRASSTVLSTCVVTWPHPCPSPGFKPPSSRTFFVKPLRAAKLHPMDLVSPHIQDTSLHLLLCGPSSLLVFTFILLTPCLSIVPMSLLLTIVIPVPEFTPPIISGLG